MSPVKPARFSNEKHKATWRFINQRPEFYELFHKFTMDRIRAGFKNYGAIEIIQQIRWHTSVPGESAKYKISNDHYPYLARIWMESNPKHKGFFRCHAVKASKRERL